MRKMGPYFFEGEFACKCHCGKNNIDMDLVKNLNKIRKRLGKPIVITSGVRCEQHNRDVGGVEGSLHLYGRAVDIKIPNSRYLFELLTCIFSFEYFSVGIGSRHVHVQCRRDGIPALAWWESH